MEAVQPSLDKPVFTADFKAAHAASLSFGFVNQSLYTGDLITLDINNSSSFWSVDGVTFSSGGKQLGNSDGINVLMGMLSLDFLLSKSNLLLILSQTLVESALPPTEPLPVPTGSRSISPPATKAPGSSPAMPPLSQI